MRLRSQRLSACRFAALQPCVPSAPSARKAAKKEKNTKGRVSRKTLGFDSNTNLLASNKLIIAQWDNHLQIGNKKIDLEYGSFTTPKLFYLNDKIFITITDVQSNKVWFFDSKGEVLSDFPVYGTSSVDLNNVDKDKSLEFICQINSDELVMYQMY